MSPSRPLWFFLGCAAGLVVGLNVAGIWPQVPVHAVATHAQDNFGIATGPVDQDIEAIIFLDFLTGDLRAAVISLQTRRFASIYEYNVIKDFPNSKNPRFLMVTGVADMRRGTLPLGQTVIYVAEVSSGQVAAYGLPWVSGQQTATGILKGRIVPLDRMKFRTAAIRNAP